MSGELTPLRNGAAERFASQVEEQHGEKLFFIPDAVAIDARAEGGAAADANGDGDTVGMFAEFAADGKEAILIDDADLLARFAQLERALVRLHKTKDIS